MFKYQQTDVLMMRSVERKSLKICIYLLLIYCYGCSQYENVEIAKPAFVCVWMEPEIQLTKVERVLSNRTNLSLDFTLHLDQTTLNVRCLRLSLSTYL